MKTAIPLTLLFLLHRASSLPLPWPTSSSTQAFPPDCAHTTCHPTLQRLISLLGKPQTPATRLTTPHFPPHQKSYLTSAEKEEAFDNSPFTPSADTPASIALSIERPLESAYLRSLFASSKQHVLGSQKEDAMEGEEKTSPAGAMPTSALPSLRQEDLHRYWLSRNGKLHKGSIMTWRPREGKGCGGRTGNMFLPGEIYIKSQNMAQRSDFVLVGIVVLFLFIVIVVEGAEKFGALRAYIFNRKTSGEIYLDTEFGNSQSNSPLSIQATPSSPLITNNEKDDSKSPSQ